MPPVNKKKLTPTQSLHVWLHKRIDNLAHDLDQANARLRSLDTVKAASIQLLERLKQSEDHLKAAQATIDSQNRELARRPNVDSIRFDIYQSSVESAHRFLDSVKVVGPGCVPTRVEALYKLYQKQESSIRELQDEVEKSLARVIDTVHKYDAAENARTILRGKLDTLIKLLKERFDIHVNES